jgi:pimeloyl-ACP methyl ester carboxylesterase
MGGRFIIQPHREAPRQPPHLSYEPIQLTRGRLILRGWLFRPQGPPRGLVVYLHGRNSNRARGAQVAEQLVPQGFAVLTYDQRGHGRSGGRYTTYGFYEKYDLISWIDALGIHPVYVIGHSAGGAVALQAAAIEPRIRGVVSVATFASLEDIIRDHMPPLSSERNLARVLAWAEREADFDVQAVSPEDAVRRIRSPLLFIHGTRDAIAPARHSVRLWRQVPRRTPSSLLVIPGAGHSDILERADVWARIVQWLSLSTPPQSPGRDEWAGG